MTRPACRGMDPEIFFPISHAGPAGIRETEQAKAVCRACPILAGCLAEVVADPPEFGVWAATTPEERRRIRTRSALVKAA
ncbi:WhiB family transcriptional regulator [Nonomuraea sp. NPDC049709]|uniref:WhiB family transcriptional regulator n=1 Tax=Nonomuraea sp. NPDC049709 TaxID=3154736 RepID=UPI00341CEC40